MRFGPRAEDRRRPRSPRRDLVRAPLAAPTPSSSRACAPGTPPRRCRRSETSARPRRGPAGRARARCSSRRNHGSIAVRSCTGSSARRAASSSRIVSKRSGRGTARRSSSSSESCPGAAALSSSRERSAFANACPKVRPIAIASPTDFMCVDRRRRRLRGTSRRRSAATSRRRSRSPARSSPA